MSSLADQRGVIARSSPYLDLAAMDDAALSVSERLALLDPERRQEALAQFSKDELAALEYDWGWKCRPDQAVDWNDDSWSTVLFLGGRGCVAPWTRIYLPLTGEHVRIDDLARDGRPITVLALTDDGPRPTLATSPFLKGTDGLLTFRLEDGSEVTTTREHRFLSAAGWTRAGDVRAGLLLAADAHVPPQESSPSRSALPAGGRRWMQTSGDSLDRCLTYPRRDDQPPRQEKAAARASVPSQADVRVRTQPGWPADDRSNSRADSHACPPRGHHGRTSFFPAGLGPEAAEYAIQSSVRESFLRSIPRFQLSRGSNVLPVEGSGPILDRRANRHASEPMMQRATRGFSGTRATGRPHASTPAASSLGLRRTWRTSPSASPRLRIPLPHHPEVSIAVSYPHVNRWQRVVSITRTGSGPFYDLHVPGPNNYLAEGIWHHNSGKTLTGAQAIREYARMKPGVQRPDALIAFVAPTPADARDVMIESADGILAISPPSERPTYQPGLRRLTWPNGTKALIFSGAEPADLRGATVGVGWLEELCKWSHLREAWNNYRLALRGGTHPRTVITTTPSRHPLFRELVSGKYPKTDVRRVSTFRNLANLPEEFVADLIQTLDGTTLGRQELYAEILDDVDGALWTQAMIDEARVPSLPAGVQLKKVVVAVDPSGSAGGDECGIVVVGLGTDDEFYVIDDLSLRASPDTWARACVDAFNGHSADRIVAEQNFGASMVEDLIRGIDRRIAYTAVHASRGKMQRAEPVAAFYERGMVHHVGRFPNLERELTEWVPGMTSWSPGRLDATVWGVAYLATFAGHTGNAGMLAPRRRIETVSVNRAAGMLPAGIMAGIASPPRRGNGRIIGAPPARRSAPWQEGGST